MSDFRFQADQGALDALLEGPSGPVAKEVTRATIKVESAAKRRCPVDTGRLRSSITHQVGQDGKGVVGVVGTDVDYAPYVEMGTSRMGAQPFLRPALSEASR